MLMIKMRESNALLKSYSSIFYNHGTIYYWSSIWSL
jgi:hypothetical protein